MFVSDISVNLERIQLLVELKICFVFFFALELTHYIVFQNLQISHAKKMHILVVFYKIICQIQFW